MIAASAPARFQAELAKVAAELDSTSGGFVDRAAAELAGRPDLLEFWRNRRAAIATAIAAVPDGARIPWFGPPMSPTSLATARLMETWAHGQDVADALGVTRTPTARLRNVAHLGVRTRDFSFQVNDRPVPSEPFLIELDFGDERWTWGPADAPQRVMGPALDFCLLVTRRRHPDELAVRAEGPEARQWLALAQAYAGPPGPGPERRT